MSLNETQRNKMFFENEHLITEYIDKYFSRNENKEDLYQTGAIYLLKSIDNFDTTMGKDFETYASSNIRYGIYNENNSNQSKSNINQNVINSICSSIQQGEAQNLNEEDIYRTYCSKNDIQMVDKESFSFIFNNYFDFHVFLNEEESKDKIIEDSFENYIIDDMIKKYISDCASHVITQMKMSYKNKCIFEDYIDAVLNGEVYHGLFSDIANKYGFSRERVRQIVNKGTISLYAKLKREGLII